jgi:MFS family permease
VRAFLGLAESGLFPGIVFYFSLWYKRTELASRMAIVFSTVSIVGSFSGFLAVAIEKLDGKAHLHGWAWLVSIEVLSRPKSINAAISSSSTVSPPL